MRMVSGLKADPAGFCIQALATRIHTADRLEPKATSQVTPRCCSRLRRSQPKKNRPTKVASRKNAVSASRASGAPNTSPTKWLKYDQLVPNWNSMVMPVATPMAKLMPNSLPQNLVMSRQMVRPVMTQTLSMMASMNDRPSVSGTNRK